MALPTTTLGASGAKVTRLCLGTMGFGSKAWRPWVVERDEALPIIERALDLGINFVDTADMYSVGESERIVGEALEGRRDDVVLATKAYHPMGDGANERGLSRKHLRRAIRASLERLGTDYVDLYQIHRYDATTPHDETLTTLHGLVEDGRVDYLGASTMWAWQFATLLHRQRALGLHPFVTMQNHYNLAYREEEREMIPLCRSEGVGLIPWSPLARGFLAGAHKREGTTRAESDAGRGFYHTPAGLAIAERVDGLAEDKGVTSAQIALAWLLHKDDVVAPIVGVTKARHVEDAVEALEVRLTGKDLEWLEAPYQPQAVAGWLRGGGVPRAHLHEGEPEA